MDALAITARSQCTRCSAAVPFNAFIEATPCTACATPVSLSAETWTTLLAQPFELAWKLAPGAAQTVTLERGGATITLEYARDQARCAACAHALPIEIAQLAARGWAICPACGVKLAVRPAPAALAHVGATLLVGEELTLVVGNATAAPLAAQPSAGLLQCPHCHAPLSVDGSRRLVACSYCSVEAYIPDDAWHRIHPIQQAARWYICLPARSDARGTPALDLRWGQVKSAVIDSNKFIYCAGQDDHSTPAVWCIGPDLRARWLRNDLQNSSDFKVALDEPGQRVLLWSPNKHSAIVLAASDGATLATLGGAEPDGAKLHHFDLADCHQLAVDRDRSILAVIDRRLLRFDHEGHGLHTWPKHGLFGGQEKLHSIYVRDSGGRRSTRFVEKLDVHELGAHTVQADRWSRMTIGWDGRVYFEYVPWIVCFDPSGNRVYRTKLPLPHAVGDQFGADATGRAYVVGYHDGDPIQRVVMRISANGHTVETIATDRLTGGVVGSEDKLVVAADGTLFLLSHGARLRVLDADGTLVWKSAATIEAEAAEDRDAARRS